MTLVKNGNRIIKENIEMVYDKLPIGNFILNYDQRIGYYLEKTDDFKLPQKIYGDTSITDRWLESWKKNTEKNMGILLSGIKGSGKTITAQKFCIDSNLPTIIINQPYEGSEFISFITSNELGEFVLFIDEFEKIYQSTESQNSLLTIMDGSFKTKIIFLFTINDNKISSYLTNRLGRIKYYKNYDHLSDEIINDVIDDLLINKTNIGTLKKVLENIPMLSLDIVVNIIKEMNLFNEPATESVKHLNIHPEKIEYEIYEIVGDKEYQCQSSYFSQNDGLYIVRKNLSYLEGENVEWEIDVDLDISTVIKLRDGYRIETHNGYVFLLKRKKIKTIF